MGDEDKQFDATPQKLQRARKEGQVVKSKDFSTALSLLIMFTVINGLAPFIWHQITKLYVLLYEQIPNHSLEVINYAYVLSMTIIPAFLIIAPILLVAFSIAVLADFMQVGPLVAVAPLMPKLDKLNPTKYFKNLISIKTAFELVKNILKVTILGVIGWSVYSAHLKKILMLASIDNNFAVMMEFGSLIVEFIFKACLAFLIIAAADYGVTKWKFLQDQKMSFKEIKDEYKNSEGDPNVKAALRQRRMQMLQRGMMDAVPESDFVVRNPIHIACALKYDQKEMECPVLVAKGSEMIAQKIIKIAEENNVPIVDINQYIPPELYKAVAEILIFVYNLKKKPN